MHIPGVGYRGKAYLENFCMFGAFATIAQCYSQWTNTLTQCLVRMCAKQHTDSACGEYVQSGTLTLWMCAQWDTDSMDVCRAPH